MMMVLPILLDVVSRELSINQIVEAKDLDGNWLHHKWCKLPYNQYKDGCRNYDVCKEMKTYDLFSKPPYILSAMKFDYEQYIRDMMELHPNWSYRQLGNIWYYQKHCRKVLKENSLSIKGNYYWKRFIGLGIMYSPEVNGINVLATMLRLGYEIERMPKKYVWFINLLYKPTIRDLTYINARKS